MATTRQRVLVCGATGFIGRNLTEALARRGELDVIGVYHQRPPLAIPSVTWRRGDLRSPVDAAALTTDVDVVVQAAAATSGAGDTVRAPHLHVTDNAVMNSVLLRAAHEAHVRRFLFFSCSIMYAAQDRPVRETDFTPGDPFIEAYFGAAWTKVYIEQMCQFYAGLGRCRFTVIRHSNIYGPHDKYDLRHSHVFGATVTKVLEGEGPVMVWGDGREARDFLHIDDLVSFVETALQQEPAACDIFNVGSASLVTVRDLVSRMCAAAGVSRPTVFNAAAPTLRVSVCLDHTKASTTFGWEPRVSLDDGIRRTLAWRRAVIANDLEEQRRVHA